MLQRVIPPRLYSTLPGYLLVASILHLCEFLSGHIVSLPFHQNTNIECQKILFENKAFTKQRICVSTQYIDNSRRLFDLYGAIGVVLNSKRDNIKHRREAQVTVNLVKQFLTILSSPTYYGLGTDNKEKREAKKFCRPKLSDES